MTPDYVGDLSTYDPLYEYLRDEILPQLDAADDHRLLRAGNQPQFRVYRLPGSHEVYLYGEEHTGTRVIGKFFGSHAHGSDSRYGAHGEFCRMRQFRGLGFTGPVWNIPRPLGRNSVLNDVLIEEYCEGATLSCLISKSLSLGTHNDLLGALGVLAAFLAALHSRTVGSCQINSDEECDYLDKLVSQLLNAQRLSERDADELSWLGGRWREQRRMWADHQVLVHGDATPGNFLFREDLRMTAIDLERARCADRVLDLGRVTGEIQHFFLRASGNTYAAEPVIGHFLHAYAHALPGGDAMFGSIISRLPFHMGTTLLRITRNSWVSEEYRGRLIEEAKRALQAYTLDA